MTAMIDPDEIAREAFFRLRQRRKAMAVAGETPNWGVDPVGWVQRRLGETIWSKQRDILESVRDNRRTVVRASYDVGKSWSASRLAAWWLDTHAAGSAFVVSTAPTFNQVRAILWREINRAHAKGKLLGRVNQTEWWIGNELVGLGRKPADYDPTSFTGIHARYVLVIIDEAGGVPAALWDAADSLVSNADSRILAIGNPTDPSSKFADICKPGSGWHEIGISAFDSPNLTGEAVPPDVSAVLVSKLWVEEKRNDWGEGTPMWTSLVEGRFPEEATDSVVPLAWATRCRVAPDIEPLPAMDEANELGVDVGGGGDETVIYHRMGPRAKLLWHGITPDPMVVVGQVINAIRDTGATSVKIDVIGIGWGVVGRLKEQFEQHVHGAEIYGVNVAESPRDAEKFHKLRDEIWWEVGRENSRPGLWDLRGASDATIGQLISPKYSVDSSGRIKVEKKDETRARLGRSPDEADALLLAFYNPVEAPDPGELYNITECLNTRCLRLFVFDPGRRCPYCGTPCGDKRNPKKY